MLIEVVGWEKLEAGSPEMGKVTWLVCEDIWLLWLILSWKQGQKKSGSRWPSAVHVEPIATMLWFGFLGWLLPGLEVRALLHRSGHYPLLCSVSPLYLIDIELSNGTSSANRMWVGIAYVTFKQKAWESLCVWLWTSFPSAVRLACLMQ